MSEDATFKPKIIIDEDWKSQVQAENAALAQFEAQRRQEESRKPAASETATSHEPRRHGPLPPASLSTLITMLATQAVLALSELPAQPPEAQEAARDEARHLIDLLQVIEDKTEGKRTAEETALLRTGLHELRLAYVSTASSPPQGEQQAPGSP